MMFHILYHLRLEFSLRLVVIFLLSCSEIEEGSPSEEVVENEETQEAVETDGENRSVSHSCRKYLVTQMMLDREYGYLLT